MHIHVDFETATAPFSYDPQMIGPPVSRTMSTQNRRIQYRSVSRLCRHLLAQKSISYLLVLRPPSSVDSDGPVEKMDLQWLPDEMKQITV